MKRWFRLCLNTGLITIVLVIPAVSVRAQYSFTNGLVAEYLFNSSASDSSGDGNNGAIIGYDGKYGSDRFAEPVSLYLNTTSAPSPNLDGTYVVAPRSPALDFNQDFTLSMWVKIPDGLGPYYVHNLLSNGPDTNGANFRVISDSDGGLDYLQFVCNHVTGDVHAFCSPLHNVWWQAMVVRSGTNVALYRNGARLTNGIVTATVPNSSSIWLGKHMWLGLPPNIGSYSLIGGIDDVRIYNRALSAQEVQQLYAYEKNPLPYLGIAVKTLRLTIFVAVGKTNQLESSAGLNVWAPYGSPFVATNAVMYQDVDIFDTQQQFFRIKLVE